MSDLNDDIIDDGSHLETVAKDRHGCVTTWLVLMIIGSLMSVLVYLFMGDMIQEVMPITLPQWAIYVMSLLGVVNIALAFLLLQYKKVGFYGFVASSVVASIFNFYLGFGIGEVLGGLVGVIVLYAILQISGKSGKSAWEHLE